MTETNRETVTIENRRAEGEEAEIGTGFHYAALLHQKGLTAEALGSKDMPLRRVTDTADTVVAGMRKASAKLASLVTEIPDEVVKKTFVPASSESLENLNGIERACLEAMKADFDRGIVSIDENADKDAYQAALKEDKTAGQSWEIVQSRLLANGAILLKKAVELSRLTGNQGGNGALLVGVYRNGGLAIRQRSQEIVNARWSKDWQHGQSDKGELKLLFHSEAMAQETGRWGNAVEIIRAVKATGYHVPADAPEYNKKGLVAAYEAVTGADYVMSPDGEEWRDAMLECPDNLADNTNVRVMNFDPERGCAHVGSDYAGSRDDLRGAVLWIG